MPLPVSFPYLRGTSNYTDQVDDAAMTLVKYIASDPRAVLALKAVLAQDDKTLKARAEQMTIDMKEESFLLPDVKRVILPKFTPASHTPLKEKEK